MNRLLKGLLAALAGIVAGEATPGVSLNAAEEAGSEPPRWERRLNDRDPVSLDLSDADLGPVLQIYSRKYGVNLVVPPDAKARVSVHLERAPAGTALRLVLRSAGYEILEEGAILRALPSAELQREQEEGPIFSQVFQLKYVDAQLLQETVKGFLSKQGRAEAFRRKAVPAGAVSPPPTPFLVVSDHARNLQAIRALVEQLDVRSRQILIEARVMEASLNSQKDLGINWNVEASMNGSRRPTSLPFEKFMPGQFPSPNSTDATNSGTGATFTFGTIDFTTFRAALKLLESDSDSQILSKPRIVTLDNQEAKITVGTTIPLELFERNRFTGNLEISGFEDKNIGIELKVTPRIGKDDVVVIDLHPKVEEILEFRGQFQRPVTRTRSVETHVAVKHGRTLVIGGLLERSEQKTETRVPLMGKIPLIGGLFRNNQDRQDKRDLLIFLTPWILQDEGGEAAPAAAGSGPFPSVLGGGAPSVPGSEPAKSALPSLASQAGRVMSALSEVARLKDEGLSLQELSVRLEELGALEGGLDAAASREGAQWQPLHRAAKDAVAAASALRQRWDDQVRKNQPLDLQEQWKELLQRVSFLEAEGKRDRR